MQVLNDIQRKEVLEGLMDKTNVSRNPEIVKEAFQVAMKKYNVKMSVKAKGTYFETWVLNTTYSNCDEVADFLRYVCNCFVQISNGKVNFASGLVKDLK